MSEKNDDTLEGGIALIGMAGRFPGARTPEALWRNILAGQESITFFTEEELLARGVDPALVRDPHYVRAKGVLEGADEFDAPFFGYGARQAEVMDPQQRVFLEVAWAALEHAGYDPSRGGRVGVWAGAALNTYLLHHVAPDTARVASEDPFELMVGNDSTFIATRASFHMNLTGPGVNVQSACSTSLLAVHMACQSLLSGECDAALAGASAIVFPQEEGYHWREGSHDSRDGHCRAFDARAEGTVSSNGVAVVVLKRLEDAIAARDTIYAVIRGTASNNDGSAKVGYMAPSVSGQAAVIAEALAMAGVDARSIGMVEAHGTGTLIGDPIEVAALTRVFRQDTQDRAFCSLGSIKSNIAHTGGPAGVAGLIKAALAVKHGVIPGTLHFERPNPALELESSPFFVHPQTIDWPRGATPRRAGVSSFGIGGTNVHAVIEQPPPEVSAPHARAEQVLTVSAKTAEGLYEARAELIEYLEQHPELDLADAAYTLHVGRKAFDHRAAWVVASRRDLSSAPAVAAASAHAPVAFVIPELGPGDWSRALYSAEPTFRAWVDRGSPDDAVTVLHALAQLWISWGVTPSALVGQGAGRVVAEVLAGVRALTDGPDAAPRPPRLRLLSRVEDLEPTMVVLELGEGQLTRAGGPRAPRSMHLVARTGTERCAAVGPDRAELGARLAYAERGQAPAGVWRGPAGASPPRVALLFTGHGAQYPGMGKALYATEPAFRAVIDRCAAHLPGPFAPALALLLGDEHDTALLEPFTASQMALFALQAGLAALWSAWGVRPVAVQGHSLGECAAAVCAGVLSVEDGLSLVHARAQGMVDRALPGEMVAVFGAAAQVERIIAPFGPDVAIAAINGPENVAIAGPAARVRPATEALRAAGLECEVLKIPQAGHSVAMQPVMGPFEAAIDGLRFQPARVPLISNLTGQVLDGIAGPGYWARHLRERVEFAQGVRTLERLGVDVVLEVGPSRTLVGAAQQCWSAQPCAWLSSLKRGRDAHQHILESLAALYAQGLEPTWSAVDGAPQAIAALPRPPAALGALWTRGVAVDWAAVHAAEARRRVPLPTYRFARRRYWIERGQLGAPPVDALVRETAPERWLFANTWDRSASAPAPDTTHERWLVLGEHLAEPLAEALRQHGHTVVRVRRGDAYAAHPDGGYTLRPTELDDHVRLLAGLGEPPTAVLHLWDLEPEAADGPLGFYSLLALMKAFSLSGREGPRRLEVVSHGVHDITGEEPLSPWQAVTLGACRVIPHEYAHVCCRNIDVVRDAPPARVVEHVLAELRAAPANATVAYRGAHRWVPGFERLPAGTTARARARLRARGHYLITGGTGKVGLLLAEHLVRTVGARVVLTARSEPTAEHLATLARLEALGGQILFVRADAGVLEDMRAAIAAGEARFGPLHGVVHAAGSTAWDPMHNMIPQIDVRGCEDHFQPKPRGALALDVLLADRPLDFVMLTSSIAVYGGIGKVAYAGANLFLDTFAAQRNRAGGTPWFAVDWDLWKTGNLDEAYVESGMTFPIEPADAFDVFDRVLSLPRPLPLAISTTELGLRVERWFTAGVKPMQRGQVPTRHKRPDIATAYVAPSGAIEAKVAEIWSELLGFEGVGAHDDFFEVGGHSLMGIRMLSRLREEFRAEIPMREVFGAMTVKGIGQVVEATLASGTRAAAAPPATIPRVARDRRAPLPLTSAQERIWFYYQLDPSSPTYNASFSVRLGGAFDVPAFERALRELVARHHILQSRMVMLAGVPHFVEDPDFRPSLAVVDVRDHAEPEAELRRRVEAETRRAFRMLEDPLIRAQLTRVAADDQVLTVTIHHIVFDGVSVAIFFGELDALYSAYTRGHSVTLPELPLHYADFAAWTAQRLDSGGFDADLAYWKDTLEGDFPLLSLPTDHARSTAETFKGKVQSAEIGPLLRAVEGLCRREGVTSMSAVLAAFKLLLHRYSGARDIVVGMPAANRIRPELDMVIGPLANTMVLRDRVEPDDTFRTLVRRVHANLLAALSHQELPFERLLAELPLTREAGAPPLFRIIFDVTAPPPAVKLGDHSCSIMPIDTLTAMSDLVLFVVTGHDALKLEYRTDLFEDSTIERMLGHLQNVLASVVESPDRPLTEVRLMREEEERQVLGTRASLDGHAGQPVRVLDAHGHLVPFGVEGALAVLAPSGALVSTGKRGRLRASGALEVTGWVGHATERQGTLVDLAEVEQRLRGAAGVFDVAVRARTTTDGRDELVAYVATRVPFVRATLEALASQVLPPAARPTGWVPVTALPYTSGGQLDEAALAALPVVEPELAARWESALGDDAVVLIDHEPPALRRVHLDDDAPVTRGRAALAPAEPLPAVPTAGDGPLAYVDGGPLDLRPDDPTTLTEALLAAARGSSGLTFVRPDGSHSSKSYAALTEGARQVLGVLQAAGLGAGDRAILQIDALEPYYTALWACILGGITPVTVATAPSYKEPNTITQKLLAAWTLLGRPVVLTTRALQAGVSSLDPAVRTLVVDGVADGPLGRIHTPRPQDVALYQLTSGSTGVAKIAQLTHRGVIAHVVGSRALNGDSSRDVFLNWLSTDHVVPIVTLHLKSVVLGAAQVQLTPDMVLSDPARLLDALERHGVTYTWMPNFSFKLVADRLAQLPDRHWDLSRVRVWLNGGEQVTLPVLRDFLDRMRPFGFAEGVVRPGYGMAEVCTSICYHLDFSLERGALRFLTRSLGGRLVPTPTDGEGVTTFVHVGDIAPGVAVRITGPDGQIVPEGVIGRVQMRGLVVTPGYVDNAEATAEALVGDGWLDSGDLGFLLDRRLTITGRAKETIIVRGANFFAHDIEDLVGRIEGVEPTYVAACATEDAASGTEGLAIFFVPKADVAERAELIRTIRARVTASLGLAPAVVIPLTREAFPKTTAGKIQRARLRSDLAAGRYRDVVRALALELGGPGTAPDWFHERAWRRVELGSRRAPAPGVVLVVHTGEHGRSLLSLLEARGVPALGLTPEAAVAAVARGERFGRIFHLGGLDPTPRDVEATVAELLPLVQVLREGDVELYVIATGAQAVRAGERPDPARAAVLGLVQTIPHELPWLRVRHVDVEPTTPAEVVLAESEHASAELEIALRRGRRWVPRLVRVDLARRDVRPWPLTDGGLCVITGGLGGLGVELARALRRDHDLHVLLIGRAPLDEARAQSLRSIPGGPREVRYAQVDVTDAAALAAAVAAAEADSGRRCVGVVHLAGTFHERTLAAETAASIVHSGRAKLAGTAAVEQLLDQRGGALIGVSSVYALFGTYQMGAYAIANRALEAACVARAARGHTALCVTSSQWDEVGMTRGFAWKDAAAAKGYAKVGAEDGVRSLLAALTRGPTHTVMGVDDARPGVAHLTEGLRGVERLRAFGVGARPTPTVADRYGTPSVASYTALAELPRTADGALDRARLLAAVQPSQGPSYVAPRDGLEAQLVEIWQDTLGVRRVGVHDRFFDLGGHSLVAVRMMARIQEVFAREVPLSALFEAPTIDRLARLLRQDSGPRRTPLVPLAEGGAGEPVFCVHPGGGTVFCYEELARELGRPFYALQARGIAEGEVPLDSIRDMASLYVGAIREVRPTGPYTLAGWSFGGVIAHEMARQLTAAGEHVSHVAMFDPVPPTYRPDPAPSDTALMSGVAQDLGVALPAGFAALESTAQLEAFARLTGLFPPSALPQVRRFLAYQRANARALAEHEYHRYEGSVSLFLPEGPDPHGRAASWSALLTPAPQVHAVPGTHLTMLVMPEVRTLAATLRAVLSR